MVISESECSEEPVLTCWDGEVVFDLAVCKERITFTCWDGEVVFDKENCRAAY